MSKKKKPEEAVVEVKAEEVVVDNTPKIYVAYVCKLAKEFEGLPKGKPVEATLMPLIVDRKNDKWENRYFVYDGDKLLGMLPIGNDIITIVSVKKGKK